LLLDVVFIYVDGSQYWAVKTRLLIGKYWHFSGTGCRYHMWKYR